MSRWIKSDHDANGPHDLHWDAGQSVEVEDERVADDLLRHAGFSEGEAPRRQSAPAPDPDADPPPARARPAVKARK
jgi:hypothetical protein